MRNDILKEIQSAVATKAKAGGYTLVVDSTANSVNQTPMLLYNDGLNDLTAGVLAQLNAGAPIDLNKPVESVVPPLTITTNSP
jgi:Skp family chaperone for outer membrane proteins